MQRGIRLSLATLLLLGLLSMIFACGSQQSTQVMKDTTAAAPKAVDMTGTWYMQVDTARGSGSPTFDIKQENTDLTGNYNGAFGTYPIKGNVDGNKFVIAFTANEIDIKYIGVIKGDSVEGEVDFGGQGKGQFVGER